MFLALVTFASRDNYEAALLEWTDKRLSFQGAYGIMERYACFYAGLGSLVPRNGFHSFCYTKTGLRQHLLMSRENALRLAGHILMADHSFTIMLYGNILQHHPEVIDQLLDLALLPRSSVAPQCELDTLAMFALSRLIHPPGPLGCAAWMERELIDGQEIVPEDHWLAFNVSLKVLCNRPGALDKLVAAYRKSVTEASEGNDRLIS